MNKKFIIGLVAVIAFFIICFIVDIVSKNISEDENLIVIPNEGETIAFPYGEIENISYTVVYEETNYVQLVINNEDIVLIELYESLAPITVDNFKSLVLSGYYDGLTFHRVIEDFMIQGGDGESTDYIVGEFSLNGYDNEINHVTGTISMARSSDYDSASSQFFICLNDTGCAHLDGSYAAFGGVIAGMDSVTNVSLISTDSSDEPLEEQIITTIRFIETEE